MLAERAPDLHDALQQVADGLVACDPGREGLPHRPLRRDHHQRQRETIDLVLRKTPSIRRQRPSDLRPDGVPDLDLRSGRRARHDLTVARDARARRAVLGRVAAGPARTGRRRLRGRGSRRAHPDQQPAEGKVLAVDNRAYNALLRGLRCLGERGFALLTGRWRALQRITASPSRIGDFVTAGMILTHFEHRDLPDLAEITSFVGGSDAQQFRQAMAAQQQGTQPVHGGIRRPPIDGRFRSISTSPAAGKATDQQPWSKLLGTPQALLQQPGCRGGARRLPTRT